MKYRQWEFDPILLRETSVQMLLKFENMVNDVNLNVWTRLLLYRIPGKLICKVNWKT